MKIAVPLLLAMLLANGLSGCLRLSSGKEEGIAVITDVAAVADIPAGTTPAAPIATAAPAAPTAMAALAAPTDTTAPVAPTATAAPVAPTATAAPAADVSEAAPQRRGLLRLFRRDAPPQIGIVASAVSVAPAETIGATPPAAAETIAPADVALPVTASGFGLFRRRAADVTPAASVAPVDVAGVRALCGAEARGSAKTTDSLAGFKLHDPAPNSVKPRAVRISGFADGCTREVTGAVVLFGRPAIYELTRVAAGRSAAGATDTAYDALKARLCGGAALCPAMQERVAFVTVHDKAGEDRRWTQLLLADGAVLASEVKTR